MAFDFPSSPALNQVYTQGGISYTWNGYGWISGSSGSASATDYVLKAGDTMTGFLTLSADPTAVMHAATKQYVDSLFATIGASGNPGEALVKTLTKTAAWGAPIESGNY